MNLKTVFRLTMYDLPIVSYFYVKWERFKAKIQGRLLHITPRGFDDQIPINNAIKYLSRDGKGGIITLSGVYNISGSINITGDNITIDGKGETLVNCSE